MSLSEEGRLKRDLSDIVRFAGGNGRINRTIGAETSGTYKRTKSHRVRKTIRQHTK